MNIVITLYLLNCRRQYQLLWRRHIILLRQKILPAERLLAVKLWNLNHCLHQGLPDLQGHLYQRHDTKTAYQPPMTRHSFKRIFRHTWAWATLIHLQVCWALTSQQPEFYIINWLSLWYTIIHPNSDDDSFSGCRLQIWTRLLKVTFRTTPVSGQTITSQFLGFSVITFKLAVTLYSSLLVFLTCPF